MEDVEILKELGHGGYATVYLCREKTSNRLVALKRIPLHRIQSPEQKRRAAAEQFLLAHTDHSFLCHGVRSFQDDEFLSLVMEYIEDARPLYQCIWRYQTARKFPERIAKYFTVQLVLAVEAIHAAGFIHRDLKSGNVLVDKRGIARVIDYGFAKRLDDGETDSQSMRTFSVCGTHYIMAPEVFLRQPYGVEVDWWGVGVIVHEMVCGRPPWEYKPTEGEPLTRFVDRVSDVAKAFSLGQQDASALLQAANVTEGCKAFIRALLQFDPRKRLGHGGGAHHVRAHPWLQDVDWQAAVKDIDSVISPYDPVADYSEHAPLVPQSLAAIASSSSAESIDAEDNARFFADF